MSRHSSLRAPAAAAALMTLLPPALAQTSHEARVPIYGQELVYRFSDPPSREPAPLIVLVAGPWSEWSAAAQARGWRVAAPVNAPPAFTDGGARSFEALVGDALKRLPVDPLRVYLAGVGEGVPGVFYLRSRLPHLWAAAAAVLGDPRPAIDSNRLFSANSALVPLLWAGRPADELAREKFRRASFPYRWMEGSAVDYSGVLDFLAANARVPSPPSIDCETGNLAFGRCYWIGITKADAARRNDVLGPSRVAPGSGASLALGGFGYDPGGPGPGVEVVWLPDDYSGPLRLKDRIVSVAGRAVTDGRDYARMMDETREEKPAAVVVQRGRERVRIETRIAVPKREENVTARVKAEWSEESRELLILSRGVAEMRVDLPQNWIPATVNWNGREVLKAAESGCWLVGDSPGRCAP